MTCEFTSSELTDEQQGRVFGILSVGCDRQTAADYVGCSLADFRREMERHPSFASDVCRAEAGAELNHMRIVKEASQEEKEWRAAVWWLERRSPERFGRRAAGAVTARQLKEFIGILVEILGEEVPSDELRQKVVARLESLAQSVERVLQDIQWDVAGTTAALIGESDASLAEDWNDSDAECK